MGDTFTDHLTPVKLNRYERDTSVDFGNRFYMRIPNDFAHLLQPNVGADVTYDEWIGRDGKQRYTITAVNGQTTRQQRQQQSRPQGGRGGPAARSSGGGPAAQAQAKTAPAGGSGGLAGAWAGMGPENRARMVADAFVRDLYKGTGTHPGRDALRQDFKLTMEAWLEGCEGQRPSAGHAGNGGLTEDLGEGPIDDPDDPGALTEDDYER